MNFLSVDFYSSLIDFEINISKQSFWKNDFENCLALCHPQKIHAFWHLAERKNFWYLPIDVPQKFLPSANTVTVCQQIIFLKNYYFSYVIYCL